MSEETAIGETWRPDAEPWEALREADRRYDNTPKPLFSRAYWEGIAARLSGMGWRLVPEARINEGLDDARDDYQYLLHEENERLQEERDLYRGKAMAAREIEERLTVKAERLREALIALVLTHPDGETIAPDLDATELEAAGLVQCGRDQTGEGYCDLTDAGRGLVRAVLASESAPSLVPEEPEGGLDISHFGVNAVWEDRETGKKFVLVMPPAVWLDGKDVIDLETFISRYRPAPSPVEEPEPCENCGGEGVVPTPVGVDRSQVLDCPECLPSPAPEIKEPCENCGRHHLDPTFTADECRDSEINPPDRSPSLNPEGLAKLDAEIERLQREARDGQLGLRDLAQKKADAYRQAREWLVSEEAENDE